VGFLIDTSVFVARERGDLSEGSFLDLVGDEGVALSAITASELLHGVHRADGEQRRARRRAFVEALLAEVPVLPVDLDVARVHSGIWADLRSRGSIIGAHDLLIAATAVVHGLTVVTRNMRELQRVDGLDVVAW